MNPRDKAITKFLTALESGVQINVPDEVLSEWFGPGAVERTVFEGTLGAADTFAATCRCTFEYLPARSAGRFTKQGVN